MIQPKEVSITYMDMCLHRSLAIVIIVIGLQRPNPKCEVLGFQPPSTPGNKQSGCKGQPHMCFHSAQAFREARGQALPQHSSRHLGCAGAYHVSMKRQYFGIFVECRKYSDVQARFQTQFSHPSGHVQKEKERKKTVVYLWPQAYPCRLKRFRVER